jgi:hypothetical protein
VTYAADVIALFALAWCVAEGVVEWVLNHATERGHKMLYRKRPITVEAIQFDGENAVQIEQWSGGKAIVSPVLEPCDESPTGVYLQVKTPEGVMTAGPGWYIIRGVEGEFYPCKESVFLTTYEPITGEAVASNCENSLGPSPEENEAIATETLIGNIISQLNGHPVNRIAYALNKLLSKVNAIIEELPMLVLEKKAGLRQ